MIIAIGDTMLRTKRKPSTVGEILKEEYLEPMSITQEALATAMGVSRKTVNELCNNRRSVTADMALILSKALHTSPEFWLNIQQQNDLWLAMNTPSRKKKIDKAKRINKRKAA